MAKAKAKTGKKAAGTGGSGAGAAPAAANRTTRRKLVAFAHRNRHHGRPLSINAATLAAVLAAQEVDPSYGALIAGGTGVVVGATTWMSDLSENEKKAVAWHAAGAGAWGLAAMLLGIDPALGLAGVVAALFSHMGTAEVRKVRKPELQERPAFDEWNDPQQGVLAKSGADGARMFHREVVHNAEMSPIGMDHHVDLSGSKLTLDTFRDLGPKIAGALPGRTRQGAVTILDDEDDVNHVTVRVIWRKQWDMSKPLLHPIVQHLAEITELVNSAVAGESRPIPEHLAPYMPGFDTIRNPVHTGVTEDQRPATAELYRKDYGALHHFGVGFTGSGKTTDINSEICSLMPKRDVIVWAIDVSLKKGKHVKDWGSCIDWLATTPEEALAMLKAAVAVAGARGEAFNSGSLVTPNLAPMIRIVIDELPELYRLLGQEQINIYLTRLGQQARSQLISLSCWGQRGTQDTYGYGFSNLLANFAHRTCMKVRNRNEMSYALESHDLVQHLNATRFLPGEAVEENILTGELQHRRRFIIRERDNEVDGDIGDILPVARLYAPFRPQLDAVSAKAAGEAYAKRSTVIPDNPLMTPANVAAPVIVLPPRNEQEEDAILAGIRTNTEWLAALMSGQLSCTGLTDLDGTTSSAGITTADATPDDTTRTSAKDDDMIGKELDAAEVFAGYGIPLGDDPDVREQRGAKWTAVMDEQFAAFDKDMADLEKLVAEVPQDVTMRQVADLAPAPKRFADDDPIAVAALAVLGRQGRKGCSMGKLVDEMPGDPKRGTVLERLRDLAHRDLVVLVGQKRGAKWYAKHHAPTPEQPDPEEVQADADAVMNGPDVF
ncbi:hypothetical protein [Saccharothrix sp. HUAS TT1]|uniref:hypothetical protein n=1 Tax=unclassified Saccharothrix TaxID=2593673 RepID=UPI00345BA8E7